MGIKLPEFNFGKMLQIIFVAFLILFLIYKFIDLNAVSSGTGDVIRPDVNVSELGISIFGMIALFLVMSFLMIVVFRAGDSPRLDKTFFLSLMIYTVLGYVVYAYLFQPLVCGVFAADTTCALPSLKVMATQMFSVMPTGVQSMFGLP